MCDRVLQMDYFAEHYQDCIMHAMGIQTQVNGNEYCESLPLVLADIMGWRQRFRESSPTEQQSSVMFLGWLENVHRPVSVFDGWLSDYLDMYVFGK